MNKFNYSYISEVLITLKIIICLIVKNLYLKVKPLKADLPQRQVTSLFLALCLISFFLVSYLGYAYVHNTSQMLETSKENAQNEAHYATSEISGKLLELENLSFSLAQELQSGGLEDSREDSSIEENLYGLISGHPGIFGIGVAYEPYAYASETRLYAPTYSRKTGEAVLYQTVYDYTEPSRNGSGPVTEWYHRALAEGAGWNEPYFGTRSGTFIVEYSLPFTRNSSEEKNISPSGVVYASYSLEEVRNLVNSLDLGMAGYGFIISEQGTVVAHPLREYLSRDADEVGAEDEFFRALTGEMLPGEHRAVPNELTGQNSWVFYEKVPSTNWTMGVVFVEEEIFHAEQEARRQLLVQLSLAFLTFLFFGAGYLCCRYGYGKKGMWALSVLFTLFCIFEIGLIWDLSLHDSFTDDAPDLEIYDSVGLETTLNGLYASQSPAVGSASGPTTGESVSEGSVSGESVSGELITGFDESGITRIPTGIFLQSIEFLTPNDVLVTGYVWQKQPEGLVSETSVSGTEVSENESSPSSPLSSSLSLPGIIFPEAKKIKFGEAYTEDGVTGWHFRATLRQPFDYSRYPIDREALWIRMWPANFDSKVVLVPDLEAYEDLNPSSLPGLEKDFVLESWTLQGSYFSFRNNTYNTDFGIENYRHNALSELYFNVGLKMSFIGPFISEITPLAVVSMLIFAVLLISTRREDKMGILGFSSSTVLAYCASLLFVLIVSHISLRGKINVSGISYLEYFYFVMYFAILMVSVNSILLASDSRFDLIRYQDNLIVKVLYWPIITGLLLLVTLGIFY